MKGRVLTRVEQTWADQYLLEAPKYRAYEHHLRLAALGGVRQAAAEYASAFEDASFYDRAEGLKGEVDPRRMAELAPTEQRRHKWLRIAVEQGSRQALDDLAHEGDAGPWSSWPVKAMSTHCAHSPRRPPARVRRCGPGLTRTSRRGLAWI